MHTIQEFLSPSANSSNGHKHSHNLVCAIVFHVNDNMFKTSLYGRDGGEGELSANNNKALFLHAIFI